MRLTANLPEWKKDENGNDYCDDAELMKAAFFFQFEDFELLVLDDLRKRLSLIKEMRD